MKKLIDYGQHGEQLINDALEAGYSVDIALPISIKVGCSEPKAIGCGCYCQSEDCKVAEYFSSKMCVEKKCDKLCLVFKQN